MSRSSIFRKPVPVAFALLTLLVAPNLQAEVTQVRDAAKQIVDQTNQFRQEHDLEPLKTNDALTKAASQFAAFMAEESKYGHHADGRTPAARAEAAGYDYCVIRENIAYRMNPADPDASKLAESFFTGWKESEEHRQNMLATFVNETGVAVATVDGKTFYAVQMFGRPESAKFQIQLQNDLPEKQTVRFHTEQSKDEVIVPPRATLTLTRCVPTELSVEGGERQLVESSASLAIRKGSDGQPIIEPK